MRIVLCISVFLLSLPAIAATKLPKGCKSIAVREEVVTIKAPKTSLVFVHNTTDADLYITHQGRNTTGDWSSRLQAKKWSALVVAKGALGFECVESRPGHEQQIPCAGAVMLCQWKKSKVPTARKGDYWAAEDMSLRELVADIGDKGYKIPIS